MSYPNNPNVDHRRMVEHETQMVKFWNCDSQTDQPGWSNPPNWVGARNASLFEPSSKQVGCVIELCTHPTCVTAITSFTSPFILDYTCKDNYTCHEYGKEVCHQNFVKTSIHWFANLHLIKMAQVWGLTRKICNLWKGKDVRHGASENWCLRRSRRDLGFTR